MLRAIERGSHLKKPSSSLASDWIQLVKIRPTLMAVITAVAAFILASDSQIYWEGVWHTFMGASFLGAGASMLNQYMEAKIDACMKRTRDRPLPGKRFRPKTVLVMGSVFTVFGIAWVGFGTHWTAGITALAISVIYVGVYTPLKTRSPWSLWAGAVPGALPPVMGWAACRGKIEWESAALFLIIFCWQFPHFMAISWVYREDYSQGGITNLATLDTDGDRVVRQMIVWTGSLVMVSLIPFFIGMAGGLYQVTMLMAGAVLMGLTLRLSDGGLTKKAKRYILTTVAYLTVLMTALLIDHAVRT